MARGAGLISQVLTIPFDIYEMHQGFSQFDREKDELLRQDGLFRGTMATTSLAVGLGIAVAAAAGASASAVAPIGFVFAGGMILASNIYNAVRVVQEIKKSITLSSAQELTLASSVYFNGSIDLESEHRVLQARYDPEVHKRAEDEASRRVNRNTAPYSAMVYAKPRTVVRVLGKEPRSDHAHAHVVQRATSEIKRFDTEWMVANGVSVRKDIQRPPDNYEIYLAPTATAIDLANGLPDSDDNWVVRQGAVSALPVLVQAGNSAGNGKVTGMPGSRQPCTVGQRQLASRGQHAQ